MFSAMRFLTTTRGSCSTTWPRPTPSASATPRWWSGRRKRDAGLDRGQRLQLARGEHLGQHHGGGLERLDLLLGIDPVGAVLDDQDAERVAGAQQRHAEEGVVDLLAGLGLVGEGRVALGVGERERLGRRGDQADEALAGAHGR